MIMESAFRIAGMHCTSCSKLVEMTLRDMKGVESISVDYEAAEGHVRFDPELISTDDIASAVKGIGYEADF
ncbi:MAG: heavy-metal-associated domain-containing protein [Actinobacteria bacterium]|nr:heavy-metal-associated domain-containing protein [Actinomycetota bacterium]